MKITYCDALVIGGGLAGLRAAVATQKRGLNTIVLSLVPVKRSHSAAAQGGMQARLGLRSGCCQNVCQHGAQGD